MECLCVNSSEEKAQKALKNYGREYLNVIQEMKDNIRVYYRIRPLLQNDSSSEMSVECILCTYSQEEVQMNNINNVMSNLQSQARDGKHRNRMFEFDKVYRPNATQEQAFEDTKQLTTFVFDGYNICIFAYGQTRSGKTYTIEGSTHGRGVNYRAIKELFEVIKQRQNFTHNLKLSMIEITRKRFKICW
ncbi:kinesin motor protein [Reticulomyxa filosa]|uniref:Kinesin motor protein n=1 Tax=Reticulomyxa filosa TaxID=46433 RepID=X6LFH6_RETFI|nr:kinesin motor protein [Reticulomyxa filosa]|eukprot:ETO00748.1 kinesin motor protein [Reticulomyxa filosa]